VSLVRKVIDSEEMLFWSGWLSKEFIKKTLKICIGLIDDTSLNALLKLIDSAKNIYEAENLFEDWLSRKNIKVSKGTLTLVGYENKKVNIQYIIIYYPENSERGKVSAEFYSSVIVKCPKDPRGYGYSFSIWQEKGEIPPFELTITGIAGRTGFLRKSYSFKETRKPQVSFIKDELTPPAPAPAPTPSDIRPPNVTSFSASASEISQGQSVTLSYSVSDDFGLKQVELWRADDSAGVGFREIKRVSISGKSNSGSFSDSPPSAGTYRYGVHVVDTSGKWNDERNSQTGSSPGVYGPRQVVVKRAPVTPPTSTPTITSPGSGSEPGQMINTLTPTLQWSKVSGADYYALAISKYPYGSSYIIYNPQQIFSNSHTVPPGVLEYGQKYRWNIQAHTSGGWSAVSNTLYFCISTAVSPTFINPQIVSISPTQVQVGQFTLTVNGSNFDSGAVDQFYTPSGQYMGSGAQSGGLVSRSSNQIVVRENLTGAQAGTYSVKIKNSNGRISNAVNIVVTAPAPTISPNVSMSPPSGSVGTTFTETGRGFTSNATATLYGRRPDGSVWQITTVTTDSSGAFYHTWTAQTPGNNFAWWAVDNPTGKKSNEIIYNVAPAPSANPLIQISTNASGPWGSNASGQQGTTFYIRGSGFSPNASVEYHVRKPDGSEYPPGVFSGKVDSYGNFNHIYTSQCTTQIGTYTVWVIDNLTRKGTNTIAELVTKNPNCR
jgi:hypothetical protein